MSRKQRYIYHKVINAKETIDKHFREPHILYRMINLSNFSRYQFVRLFKSIYRITPNQYLAQVRVSQAKQDLIQTDAPIAEIAENLGFQNHSTFSNIFRRFTGQYPLKYRELSQTINKRKDIQIQNFSNFSLASA
ncbi:MAG: helix-turn-helix transcriptional regulator [Bacteroidota bacterium]